MKQHLILAAAGLLMIGFAACDNKQKSTGFQLKGQLKASKGETIYFEKLSGPQPVLLDSTVLDENGNFDFSSYTPKIGFYRLKLNNQNFAMLVLDSADKVTLSGDATDLGNTYTVEGSEETKLFLAYNDLSKARDLRLDSLNKAFQLAMEPYKMDSKRVDSLSAIFEGPYNAIIGHVNKALVDMIRLNADKYASIMAIQALEPDKYPDVYKALDEGLSKKFPNDRNVMMFHDVVTRVMATTLGQTAPDIVMPGPDGKELALSSFRGKVVLIDFWASWCGPCRKEMPNVVKAYAKYKNKGFEIFGVSLDQDKQRWLDAISKDGITWPQVSDLKYWENAAARVFNVQSIPYTVLLDKDGKILDKNLRGEALEKRLAELLN
ncbi:MAG TPA: TlpA disulfide reductase family protein [Bacteroidia bacterium]|nr:TlpA disulfide reductase family protein [Bacteroidia bacterium]